jgi:hypothetical protein
LPWSASEEEIGKADGGGEGEGMGGKVGDQGRRVCRGGWGWSVEEVVALGSVESSGDVLAAC